MFSAVCSSDLKSARREAEALFYEAEVAYEAQEKKLLALRKALAALGDEELAALELPLRKQGMTSMGVWDALMTATSEVELKHNGKTRAREGCIAPLYDWWAERNEVTSWVDETRDVGSPMIEWMVKELRQIYLARDLAKRNTVRRLIDRERNRREA